MLQYAVAIAIAHPAIQNPLVVKGRPSQLDKAILIAAVQPQAVLNGLAVKLPGQTDLHHKVVKHGKVDAVAVTAAELMENLQSGRGGRLDQAAFIGRPLRHQLLIFIMDK